MRHLLPRDLSDLLKLGLRDQRVIAGGASKAAEDIPRLVEASHFYEPAGRLGEEPHSGEEDQQGKLGSAMI